ncbi:MAG: hypothetical protein ACM36C_06760 [Acidobacteriota bacterium]
MALDQGDLADLLAAYEDVCAEADVESLSIDILAALAPAMLIGAVMAAQTQR